MVDHHSDQLDRLCDRQAAKLAQVRKLNCPLNHAHLPLQPIKPLPAAAPEATAGFTGVNGGASTVRAHTKILEDLFLVHQVDADEQRLAEDGAVAGTILESFVVMELLRQADCADHPARLFHYRDNLDPRFKAGAVIHTGADTLPFGDRLAAVPVSGL